MSSSHFYPWFFFYRISKLAFIIFFPALLGIIFLFRSFHREKIVTELEKVQPPPLSRAKIETRLHELDQLIIIRIIPLSLLSYLIFMYYFYQISRPLGPILSKVDKLKNDISIKQNLELLFKKDEWANIEAALKNAEIKIREKILEVQTENEKNSAILESINDEIIAIDRFESVMFYNTKFKNHFIFDRDGREIEKKIWHIFDNQVLAAFREVLSHGNALSLKSIQLPPSEYSRFFDLTITSLRSPNGAISGALGVFHDITEFKLAEKMRVDFVANVSHEIRTPLTSIKGFSQIILNQSEKMDESLRPFFEKIISNTERMISLFHDLLGLSVIESADQLKLEDILLLNLIDAVEENIKASYPNKTITFSQNLQINSIRGDAHLIERVFLNLYDNACKYSLQEVHISIQAEEIEKKIQLKISDNGPGIAEEHLPRIFERFYRIEASRESIRGTGLGLAIVKQIISKHHGKIWATSEGVGQGSVFIIEIPGRSEHLSEI